MLSNLPWPMAESKLHFVELKLHFVESPNYILLGLKLHFVELKLHFVELKLHFVKIIQNSENLTRLMSRLLFLSQQQHRTTSYSV
mgnify:CR=1 FL=1